MTAKRLGFFTRILDDAPAATRYGNAIEQIQLAVRVGFDSAWVAQHHFHRDEGGLPSPLVFLSHVAARTRRIRLGTGIITLPLENALRVAEDAAVLDLLSHGRLEVGVGSGGTPTSFTAFGLDVAHTLEELEATPAMIPIGDAARAGFPSHALAESEAVDVRYGRKVAVQLEADGPVALFAPDGEFLALYEQADDVAKAVAVFV